MGNKRVIKSETVSFVPGTTITWMYIAGISYINTLSTHKLRKDL